MSTLHFTGHAFQKIILFLITLLTFRHPAQAQKENNVWVFGHHAGLDFSSGTPTPIITDIDQIEGCASVCDTAGNLLMYSDGYKVWDRSHTIMPNGTGLAPLDATNSTTQACVIAKSFENENRYYVFSLEFLGMKRLFYSVVDMSLNGGKGDVVPGQKMIILEDGLTEKMTLSSTACKAWLMVREQNEPEFKAFELGPAGLKMTPVISVIGNGTTGVYSSYAFGAMKFSNDNKMLACPQVVPTIAVPPLDSTAIELFDFDFETGILSNSRLLDRKRWTGLSGFYMDACFSPDNTKLYVSNHRNVIQYDVSLPSIAHIIASKTVLGELYPTYVAGGIELGPDDKIYIANQSSLHCINYPNLAGLSCQLVPGAIGLPRPSSSSIALPNRVIRSVKEKISSAQHIKTCTTATLSPVEEATKYLWSTGATSRTIQLNTSGIYSVQYTNADCRLRTDSFTTIILPLLKPNIGHDTTFCEAQHFNLSLNSNIPGVYNLIWSNSDTTRTISATDTGNYSVKITTPGCEAADSIRISVRNCNCFRSLPNAFSPNNDGLNDLFPSSPHNCNDIAGYRLSIYNRWGQCLFSTYNLDQKWNGNFKGLPADAGIYMFHMSYSILGVRDEYHIKGDLALIR